ncbi:protein DMP4 [Sesamum angolense]|uniref:Protein DMP4 n=1 Tax=Sesamum angolense TaxID=2727404 RepID=A0AAE1WT53_9LAMI|nr:protein DMP4 [Sesamum angolense]
MEIKVENDNESSQEISEQDVPLLVNKNLPEVERNAVQQAISQTFESTAHLANLLPTGSVLAFQLLSPVFSNQGECDTVSRSLTAVLMALCGLSCILLSFTDSIKDQKGNICYGFATFHAIALFDENVVNCFYPAPSTGTKEVLTALPVGIGVACTMLFVVFPTKRHGIGFPVSSS